MRLLILGGTKFLGKHVVIEAKKRGHDVTLFNRGKSNPDLFPDVETIIGDRDGDLSNLQGKTWDAVIDTSGYVPRHVNESVNLLKEGIRNYTFISTISVYKDFSKKSINEEDAVSEIEDTSVEEVNGDTYGPLKALCEEVVRETFPTNYLIIRPGLIVGPDDPTDRFTYWPLRFYRGGEIVVPNSLEQPIQWIDVRDLAKWIIYAIENNVSGTYNATGPDEQVTFAQLFETAKQFAQSELLLTLVDEEFLLENKVGPWVEMPFWLPKVSEHPDMWGMLSVNNDQAIQAGLTFRPLKETIEATINWCLSAKNGQVTNAGMTEEREKEILAAWKNKNIN